MDKEFNIRINDQLNKEGNLWWYNERKGEVFKVKRDPINPHSFFYLIKNRQKHQIRCCDCKILN